VLNRLHDAAFPSPVVEPEGLDHAVAVVDRPEEGRATPRATPVAIHLADADGPTARESWSAAARE
jgi:hypothetical protein